MPDQIRENKRRAILLAGTTTLVAAVVLGLIGFFALGWIGLLLGVAVSVAITVVLVRRSTAAVVTRTGAVPADAGTYARYHNVVEGLCVAGGVPKPTLMVLDEPALNTLTCGRAPRDAVLVVTTGLLSTLSRIELEGVLAHELTHVKNFDILPSTLAAAIPGATWIARWQRSPAASEGLADLQAVGMTRYPPGLLSALEKLQADTTPMAARSATITHLWLKPPETGPNAGPAPLAERIEALKEL